MEPRSTVGNHEFVEPCVFEGGARIGLANWSIPWARLTVDREMAMVSVRALPFGHEPVWIARDQVKRVVRVQGMLISPGLVFVTADGRYDGLIFWTISPRPALESLRHLGWPATTGKLIGRS